MKYSADITDLHWSLWAADTVCATNRVRNPARAAELVAQLALWEADYWARVRRDSNLWLQMTCISQ